MFRWSQESSINESYSTDNEITSRKRRSFNIQDPIMRSVPIINRSSITPKKDNISSFTCRLSNYSCCFIDSFILQKYEIEKWMKFTKRSQCLMRFIYLFVYLLNVMVAYIFILMIVVCLMVIHFTSEKHVVRLNIAHNMTSASITVIRAFLNNKHFAGTFDHISEFFIGIWCAATLRGMSWLCVNKICH